MAAQIGLLLAAERSGTHLLRSLLGQVPDVKAPGEIANAASGSARTSDTSFLKFRRQAWTENPDYFFTTIELQNRLLEQFFELVRTDNPRKRLVVLDVKYSHVHNFNACWWDPSTRPLLLEFARKSGFKVIHLVRSKVYRTAISQLYAQESGVYRARKESDLKAVKIVIAQEKLAQRVGRLTQSVAQFDRWLHGSDHIRITYEDLTENTTAALKALAQFLGLEDEIPPQPGFVKTTPPYEDSIQNFGEIAHLIDIALSDGAARQPGPHALPTRA